MLVIGYALKESEYNKSFLYTEVLIGISDYTSTHFPHLNFLNSITSYWSIYKHWLEFKFTPKNKLELEATLKELLESYN